MDRVCERRRPDRERSSVMRALIVYYSRTGNTRKVAQELAAMLGANLAEVRCDRYLPGFLRRLLATYHSIKGKLPDIECPSTVEEHYDLVLIGGPLWVGRPALPIRAFLAMRKWPFARTALFPTHIGSPPDRAFAEMEALLAAPATAKLALRASDIRGDRLAAALRPFVAQLAEKKAAA
jgi:hypothetical protein